MQNSTTDHKRKFWAKMIWISTSVFILSICLGVLVPLIGIFGAFGTLSKSGSADPAELAQNISTSLIGGIIAIPLALISLTFFIISIFRHRKLSNPALVN
ncbi:MAG: MotA/TolQ/ExbB proton channel family protein [Akkermansiaceae bacterium]